MRAVLFVVLLLMSSGCSDLWDQVTRPNLPVKTSDIVEHGWNRDPRVRVVVDEPGHQIVIQATSTAGQSARANGTSDATLQLKDGTWDVSYTIDGHKWGTFHEVRIDSTPPSYVGLVRIGNAVGGAFVIGQGASVVGASSVTVVDLETGAVLSHEVPIGVTGLTDGLHAYGIAAQDEAGNWGNATVQVRVGSAAQLPDGQYDFGVVARFSTSVKVWDLSASYPSRSEARAAAGNEWVGSGFGITPNDAAVQEVVSSVVRPDMDTVETAIALYQYMADHLEYDDLRLDSEGLLTPHQVLKDTEDAQGRDDNHDGLVDDGSGNGVAGGICRDLAATYVSLLRASGIPARLVSGYVGGSVNGFHAWVEFYAGGVDGEDAWMPVDVSPIDGPYRVGGMLQAFGIRIPDYLALRVVPAAGETDGWSTALGVQYSVPSGSATPDIQFGKKVTEIATDHGVLCFDPDTLEREVVSQESACAARFSFFVGNLVTFAERVVDYGIDVRSAPAGTRVSADVAYPTDSGDSVDFAFYPPGQAFTLDAAAGKAHAEIA